MTQFKISVGFLLGLIVLQGCTALKYATTPDPEPVEIVEGITANMLGKFHGTLTILHHSGNQEIAMDFELSETDSVGVYHYIITYQNEPRNYKLKVVDAANQIYEIDEQNGIILPAFIINETIYSYFEVEGNLLSTRLSFEKKFLDFEIIFSPLENQIETGGGLAPLVYGYPITSFQKARLKRV